MVIFLFTLLFLFVFFLTRSCRFLERYYPTVMYVSFVSILYALICTDYNMWHFPVWWIFTDHAFALFQAAILFPSTTVLFLRYLPKRHRIRALYFLFFVALYGSMEWIMLQRGEIRYGHGWSFTWSIVVDALMFFMMWLHERNLKLTWILTAGIIAWLVVWFDVPLFVL